MKSAGSSSPKTGLLLRGSSIESLGWLVIITLGLGFIYWRTLLPVIGYWGDMAKFDFLGKVLGTPHLSVYPNYILLNNLWVNILPKGTLAFKANLLSAVFSIIAMWFFFGTLLRLNVRKLLAFISTLVFGLTYSFWSYSLVAEVYTLNVAFTIAVIFFLIVWNQTHRDRYFYLAALTYAISFGNHLTMVGILPAFGYMVWVTDRRAFVDVKKIVAVVGFILLGFAQYLFIVWRTNDPNTAFLETNTEVFIQFITTFKHSAAFGFSFWELISQRIPITIGYIWREFTVLILFSIWGMLQLKNRAINLFLLICLIGETLFSLNLDGRETWVFFLPTYLILGLYLGVGLEDITRRFLPDPRYAILWLALPILMLSMNYQRLDQSERVLHARIVEKVLSTVEKDAVIVVDEYDYACFFWYYLIGEGYEKKGLYAFPLYFAGAEGLKAYLRDGTPISLYPQRKAIPPGIPVYAQWTLVDLLEEAGFQLEPTGTKFVYRLKLEDSGLHLPSPVRQSFASAMREHD